MVAELHHSCPYHIKYAVLRIFHISLIPRTGQLPHPFRIKNTAEVPANLASSFNVGILDTSILVMLRRSRERRV